LLWRGDSVWREDYNKNQPRDSRGRWSSGGGGGGKKSGGGGGGLASKKVAELQEIAKAEGVDPDTLSHKRRKSVLAAAIEAKRKGKDLREAGLLKPTKTKGGLRGQSKKKPKPKPKDQSKKKLAELQEKANNIKPWKDAEYNGSDNNSNKKRKDRQEALINAPSAPPKLKKLSQTENEELDNYNNILMANMEAERTSRPEMKNFMNAIGMKAHDQASVASRSLALNDYNKQTQPPIDKLDRELRLGGGYALGYAGQIGGRYGQLYNRRVAESLEKLPNKNIVHIASRSYYTQSPRIGEPLQTKYLADRTPTVLVAELKRRKLLDVDNPGVSVNVSRQRLRNPEDLKGVTDNWIK